MKNRKLQFLLGPVLVLVMFAAVMQTASWLMSREYEQPYGAPAASVDPTPRAAGLADERADAEARDKAKLYEEAEYRTFPVVGSRVAIWAVAQLHLLFAAFVLAVPLFAIIIEVIGYKTGDPRYDRLAHEFTKLLSVSFSLTATFGAFLTFMLIALYPKFTNYLMSVFSPTLIEGTDELLPVAKGIGARRIDGSIYHWRAEASGDMPETFISCTGVGTQRSYDCTKKRIAETNPGLIVSAGTFGAIVEDIPLTHWMCNAQTRMLGSVEEKRATKDSIEEDTEHVARLRQGCDAVGVKWLEGRLICVPDVPLFLEEEKAALARSNDAIGVDMETFGIAQAAREAGIPWVTARVCVDTPSIPLPDFGALNHTTGRPYYRRLFKWIFLHPIKCVPTLYGLWKLVNVYGKQLAAIVRKGYLKP
jgi:hypothetical protein